MTNIFQQLLKVLKILVYVCFFRRVGGGYSGAAHKRHVKSLPQHEQKPHHETSFPDKSDYDERIQETRKRFLFS